MATGQVLFHRFYRKKPFAHFNVKNGVQEGELTSGFFGSDFKGYNMKFAELKIELSKTERHLLKEMGFVCHAEHPHKFISNYPATGTPQHLRREAWNLANDSLRVTLWKACGVVYTATRRFQAPLPENQSWWKALDAEKSGIDEVCKVLVICIALLRHSIYLPARMEIFRLLTCRQIHNCSQF